MRTPTLMLTGLMLAASPAAFADANTAGQKLLATLNNVLTGDLMLFVGLGVAVLGLWAWLIKQETMAGILMIIGGVVLTAAPAIFNGMSTVVTPVVDELGATGDFSTTQTQTR
ncbi:MAG: hypothetical protein COY40_04140 [Alphaproteobacteria bacterium CG_4_10_14_0_8_um_filter_53_9]|nr:MAG: hypothetical protein COY40_04140 [Alphaproteobacteria bacterium CG_4_10_14_0_8_um_filter_53_9]